MNDFMNYFSLSVLLVRNFTQVLTVTDKFSSAITLIHSEGLKVGSKQALVKQGLGQPQQYG